MTLYTFSEITGVGSLLGHVRPNYVDRFLIPGMHFPLCNRTKSNQKVIGSAITFMPLLHPWAYLVTLHDYSMQCSQLSSTKMTDSYFAPAT